MLKQIIILFSLIILLLSNCASKGPEVVNYSVEEAQKIIEAKRADLIKNADKLKKEAIKRNLKIQSKAVRKSIKTNKKRLKRRFRIINKTKITY